MLNFAIEHNDLYEVNYECYFIPSKKICRQTELDRIFLHDYSVYLKYHVYIHTLSYIYSVHISYVHVQIYNNMKIG